MKLTIKGTNRILNDGRLRLDAVLFSPIFISFCLFVLFTPTSLQYIPSTVQIYKVIQICKLIVIGVWLWIYVLRNRYSWVFVIATASHFPIIVSSFFNNVGSSKPVTNLLLTVGLICMTEINYELNKDRFYKTGAVFFSVLAIINLIFCLRYPHGLSFATLYRVDSLNPIYFLGIDNAMIKSLMPLILFLFLTKSDVESENNSKLLPVMLAVVLATLVIVQSSTGLLVGLVMIGTLLICNTFKVRIPVKIYLLIITVFMAVTVISGNTNSITNAITGFFERRGSFTGRTILWNLSVNMIKENLWLGYGYTSGLLSVWNGFFSSHNQLLELTLQGGIFACGLYLLLIIKSIWNTRKVDLLVGNTLSMIMIGVLLGGMMETGIPTIIYVAAALSGKYSKRE